MIAGSPREPLFPASADSASRCVRLAHFLSKLRPVALALLVSSSASCMTTTTRYATRTTGQREILIGAAIGTPSVSGHFSAEPGLVRGHVGWTADCRTAIVSDRVTDEITLKEPNGRAGVAASTLGACLGALSVGMLASAHQFSALKECSANANGYYSCASSRDFAIGTGVIGILGAAALEAAGVATLASQASSSVVSSQPAQPVVSRITGERVSCGDRPVQELSLSLVKAGAHIVTSSTNADGDVAFAVPTTANGVVTVVVDAVPPTLANIQVGDVIGSIELLSNGDP